MTVTSDTNRWTATGNGVTTAFPYTNKILVATDLKVYIAGVLQTLTTHYSVSGAGSPSGGTVTFVTAPANLASVVIVRDVPYTQETTLVDGGSFPAALSNAAHDKNTILAQQNKDADARALRQPDADAVSLQAMPVAAQRVNGGVIGFGADPTLPIIITGFTGDPGVVVSSFAATLLDDADAASARATLGAGTGNGTADYPTKGADVASASTLDLSANETDQYVDVTGTTTITAIESRTAGREIELRFAGILTLTHNATSLILPTGANITTAAGDVARFRSLGSGNWKCNNYVRAAGTPLAGIFTKEYLSVGQTITLGGALTLAHGLGVVPKLMQLYLKCTSGELGYSTGDEVFINPHDQDPAGSGSRGIAFKADATNLTGRYGSGATEGFRIHHGTTGTGSGITNANWQLYVRAFA